MGGWANTYCLFVYYIFILKNELFFNCKFLSNLTSQKNH